MSVMTSAVALAVVLAAGDVRAEAPAAAIKVNVTKPVIGQFRYNVQQPTEDTDKELTRGWYRGGWGRGWHGYRGYRGYYGYSYYRPYYYYSTPVYYYSTPVYYSDWSNYYCPPTYYYYCQSATLGTNAEPRSSAERAEFKMTVPASLRNDR
jgi:hypothetical protein